MTETATPEAIPGIRDQEDALLRVTGLSKTFFSGSGRRARAMHAVSDVSFDILRGETLGLVGESGSGKSTIGRAVLRLMEATAGSVQFDGEEIRSLSKSEMRSLRSRMQMVFQDPHSALDSRMTVGEIIAEPLVVHGISNPRERAEKVRSILDLVGIPASAMEQKPHSFSGGQRQRIAMARSLVLNPSFVVLDEPVTALDVSVQAQVLNLLMDLRSTMDLSYLFIVHDLAIAERFCHRVAVLYRGEIVELAQSAEVFAKPLHPYTVALLSAAPVMDPSHARERILLRGDIAEDNESQGCPFRARCPIGAKRELCATVKPKLREDSEGHWAACHFSGELKQVTGSSPEKSDSKS